MCTWLTKVDDVVNMPLPQLQNKIKQKSINILILSHFSKPLTINSVEQLPSLSRKLILFNRGSPKKIGIALQDFFVLVDLQS